MTQFIISFLIWAGLHSIAASRRTKAVVRRKVGERIFEGWYRLFYNVFAFVTIMPVFYILWTIVPETVLWQIPQPFSYVASGMQLIGLVGLTASLWQTDVWEFLGVRQAWRYLQGEEEMTLPPKLVTSGTYAWVRHPLYFFSMLLIWVSPVMTLNSFLFNLLATGYFWAGSRVEERRLADYFGERYEAYRRRVPGLVPLPWRGRYQG
jgi:protein-S-isoprenylcysteine O-methyltransferase Ste14